MNIIGYVLFFVAGLGFGFAAPRWGKFLPLLFPLLLAAGAVFSAGWDGEILVRLIVALVVTIVGIVLGAAIDAASQRRGATA